MSCNIFKLKTLIYSFIWAFWLIEKEADLSNLMKNYFGKITCGVDFDLIKFFWFDSILIWFHGELELNGLHLHTEFIWFGLAGGGACLG